MALGGVSQLVTYATGAMLIVGTLSVAAVAVLRRREPDLPRPYRVPLYPLPLVLFCAASLLVLAVLTAQGNESVLVSVGWFVAALGVHWGLARRRRRRPRPRV
jgi:APA family basic amino acid/polyamine antiporter